jgi:hypothetical protein
MQPARATFLGFVPRLAAFYAALFILPGIQMPFFPVWLRAKGLDPKMIGFVLAVPMVVRILAIPVVTPYRAPWCSPAWQASRAIPWSVCRVVPLQS